MIKTSSSHMLYEKDDGYGKIIWIAWMSKENLD